MRHERKNLNAPKAPALTRCGGWNLLSPFRGENEKREKPLKTKSNEKARCAGLHCGGKAVPGHWKGNGYESGEEQRRGFYTPCATLSPCKRLKIQRIVFRNVPGKAGTDQKSRAGTGVEFETAERQCLKISTYCIPNWMMPILWFKTSSKSLGVVVFTLIICLYCKIYLKRAG